MAYLRPERERLARTGDDSMVACAHRLRAARDVAGVGHAEIAGRLGRWRTPVGPTIEHIAAAEAGREFPNAALQRFYWDKLKLTAEFFDEGSLQNIPVHLEDLLFAALKSPATKG